MQAIDKKNVPIVHARNAVTLRLALTAPNNLAFVIPLALMTH